MNTLATAYAGKQRFNYPARKRLRNYLLLFAVCLSLPLIFLVQQGYKQFQWEMYFPYRWSANQTIATIRENINARFDEENNRPVGHYRFYVVEENPLSGAKAITLSPLADSVAPGRILGLKGYFQIDAKGEISTPLLPFKDVGRLAQEKPELEWAEIDRRLKLQKEIEALLTGTGLQHSNELSGPVFLNRRDMATRVEQTWSQEDGGTRRFIETNKESGMESAMNDPMALVEQALSVGPLQTLRTMDGHFVFFRFVQGGSIHLQGFIVEQKAFLMTLIADVFATSNFECTVALYVYYSGQVIDAFLYTFDADGVTNVSDFDFTNQLEDAVALTDGMLIRPLDKLGLDFQSKGLPIGPASLFMGCMLVIVGAVIVSGLLVIYRLGLRQIRLAEDRLNFVSAVSHELRTPLTSIIMYSEMLRENMVIDEGKRRSYYDFIFDESERLSRLINNVLQLSRLSRNDQQANTEYTSIDTLLSIVQSKVSTLVEKNGFHLEYLKNDMPESSQVLVDLDAFSQIAINLVDNAVKFSSVENQQSKKQIDLGFSLEGQMAYFSVRDYGPGIAANQSKKIFELFYRSGNELTRTRPGTGIGLALVSELAKDMGGYAQLVNRSPGAEFRVYFLSKSI